MRAARAVSSFLSALRIPRSQPRPAEPPAALPKIGLALGGGFARGIAHAGVLAAFERHGIPIHCITGVSAGSIVAAAYASGATPQEIARAGCAMRFGDVARWSLCRMGFVVSERMKRFLERLLKAYRFEEMRMPLGVIATDLGTGHPVSFRDRGDVVLPIRASCSYPGLFQPVRYDGRMLVDGAISMEMPAALARELGATHVISVHLPTQSEDKMPTNVFQVVNRCFQIMQARTEESWRRDSDLIIVPDVRRVDWDGFGCGPQMVQAGEDAAVAAMQVIRGWFPAGEGSVVLRPEACRDGIPAGGLTTRLTPDSGSA
jgi:NTE family protein